MASLLELVHPALQTLGADRSGQLRSLVKASLDLVYDAPLPEGLLQGELAGFDWTPLNGTGTLQIQEASFAESPLMGQVLQLFGLPADTTVYLKPIQFTVANGRLTYGHPWEWKIQGSVTKFRARSASTAPST
ncbi:MAG: hypothetical protein R3E96_05505 [Planctomycetota bacterium]